MQRRFQPEIMSAPPPRELWERNSKAVTKMKLWINY